MVTRLRVLTLLLGSCLWLQTTTVMAAESDEGLRLALLFKQSFANWDYNQDGVLTKDELDQALQNPAIKGNQAAALAAIKIYSRSAWKQENKQVNSLERFTLSDLCSRNNTDTTGNDTATALPKLVSLFNTYQKKISNESPLLFSDGRPHIEEIRQGKTGDCYFLATIGGLAYHTPQRVIDMITQNSDGSYAVTFPRHQPIAVPAPTDAEIACYSDAGEDGVWLHVCEKAYAIYKNRKTRKDDTDPLEVVIHGGSGARMLMFMTGNSCSRYPTKTTSIEQLRQELTDALSNHRIVNTGTSGHCLTILGYNPTTDIVTVWNPWGTTGNYSTVNQQMNHGVFSMPLTDLQNYFVSILPEKARPWTIADFKRFR
ncbi:MAG: C2 family cysteine protease [Candidatus Obscuribacterales bacterium]